MKVFSELPQAPSPSVRSRIGPHGASLPSAAAPRGTPAFSLVEVALAMGLLSFCVITLMGLIPVALQASRESMNKNMEIRMRQAVQAQLLAMPTSGLSTTGNYSFDPDGFLRDNTSTNEQRYLVEFATANQTVLPSGNPAKRLTTVTLIMSNVITHEKKTNHLHLPDNGF